MVANNTVLKTGVQKTLKNVNAGIPHTRIFIRRKFVSVYVREHCAHLKKMVE